MTSKDFFKNNHHFLSMNVPPYRGAAIPEFNEEKINESAFDDALRFHDARIAVIDPEYKSMTINWESYKWPDNDIASEAVNGLVDEIVRFYEFRAKKYNLETPFELTVNVSPKDSTTLIPYMSITRTIRIE